MSEYEVSAQPRADLGKGASRRLRRQGLIPAVLYGGTEDPISLMVRENELKKQLENEAFYSHLLTVSHEGRSEQAVLKGLQRHPATDDVIHIDFQRASATQVLHMLVPLHFVNEDTCAGVKLGGAITRLMIEVDVTCQAKDLPEYIEVDVQALEMGEMLHLSDIKLPPGVELTALSHGDDAGIVNVHAPHVAALEDEGEEGEEGEEAAGEE